MNNELLDVYISTILRSCNIPKMARWRMDWINTDDSSPTLRELLAEPNTKKALLRYRGVGAVAVRIFEQEIAKHGLFFRVGGNVESGENRKVPKGLRVVMFINDDGYECVSLENDKHDHWFFTGNKKGSGRTVHNW